MLFKEVYLTDQKFTQYASFPLISGDTASYRIVLKTNFDLHDAQCLISAMRSDGKVLTDYGETNGNTAVYIIKSAMYSVPGELTVRLKLVSSDGSMLTDKEVIFKVNEGFGVGASCEKDGTSLEQLFTSHMKNFKNPHHITAGQLGLGDVNERLSDISENKLSYVIADALPDNAYLGRDTVYFVKSENGVHMYIGAESGGKYLWRAIGNIEDSAVTQSKIADGAVTSSKIKDGSIGGNHITAAAIGSNKIANGAVTKDKIANGAVTKDKIANGAITRDKIDDAFYQEFSENIFDNIVVTEPMINPCAVTSDKLDPRLLPKIPYTVLPNKIDITYLGSFEWQFPFKDENIWMQFNSDIMADISVDSCEIMTTENGRYEIVSDTEPSEILTPSGIVYIYFSDERGTGKKAYIKHTSLTAEHLHTFDKIIGEATTDKIADNSITTSKISNSAVTADKISDNSVTEVKLSDDIKGRLPNIINPISIVGDFPYLYKIPKTDGFYFINGNEDGSDISFIRANDDCGWYLKDEYNNSVSINRTKVYKGHIETDVVTGVEYSNGIITVDEEYPLSYIGSIRTPVVNIADGAVKHIRTDAVFLTDNPLSAIRITDLDNSAKKYKLHLNIAKKHSWFFFNDEYYTNINQTNQLELDYDSVNYVWLCFDFITHNISIFTMKDTDKFNDSSNYQYNYIENNCWKFMFAEVCVNYTSQGTEEHIETFIPKVGESEYQISSLIWSVGANAIMPNAVHENAIQNGCVTENKLSDSLKNKINDITNNVSKINNDVQSPMVMFGSDGKGWYRIAEIRHSDIRRIKGYFAQGCEIILRNNFTNNVAEYYHLYFTYTHEKPKFNTIISRTWVQIFTKIRYVLDEINKIGYIEIYYNSEYINYGVIALNNAGANISENLYWKINYEYTTGTDDTPQDGIVKVTYNIPANEQNNNEDIYRKRYVTRNVSNGFTGEYYDSGDGISVPLNGCSIQESGIDFGTMIYTASGGGFRHIFKSYNDKGTSLGEAYIDGGEITCTSLTESGADYAEMWEWKDGNPNNEDRAGYFVAFDGDKIRLANTGDNISVVAVSSAVPAILGDAAPIEWHGKYMRDKFGRIQYHDVHYPPEYNEIIGKDGEREQKIVREEMTLSEPVLNPEYNPGMKYTPRNKRPEWCAVGTHGKLIVYDDGSCIPNGFCMPNDEGKATDSVNGFYVMKRISDNLIKIYMR